MPIPLLQLQKETLVSCRQAKRLVTELFSPRFVTMQWLCSQSCSKWGSAAHVFKMWLTARGDLWDMLVFRNPFPPFLLGISIIHSLPEAGSWERQYAPPALHGCILPIPSLQLQEITLVSCRQAKRLVTQSWFPRFGISCNTVIALSVVLWDCCKPTNTYRDWAFSNSGLEVGLPAFQLPMFPKCDSVQQEVCGTC